MEFTVTVTGPWPAETVLGTVATICESLQLVTVAAGAPLNLIVLFPCELPKLDPVMVTEVPTPPAIGETPVTYGVVPTTMRTLSNVAVSVVELDPLLTASPT